MPEEVPKKKTPVWVWTVVGLVVVFLFPAALGSSGG